MRLADLRLKEVINSCNCKRLGFATDILFDVCTGTIAAIIVPGPGKFCQIFGRDMEYVIPYKCIKQIGDDIILVEINDDEVLRKCGS
ncbi:MAG: YlmC/YmxH family sporulation protein [Lachnospiraceae bacterium]|nr:YlmC/YmxH family sporulation protein [Lachnospiraceae bacterium]